MVVATYKLQVAWGGGVDWDASLFPMDFPVTWGATLVVANDRIRSISCSFGRDRASQLTGNSKAGTMRVVLDNRSGE